MHEPLETKVNPSSFQLIHQQPRSGALPSYFLTEILSLFTNNIRSERCNVLNRKGLKCLRTQELAPVDATLSLDH